MPAPHEVDVPVGDETVAVRDLGGDGPDVLLVHGAGGNLAHWDDVVPLLTSQFRLVALDLPAHGASSSPPTYSFDDDVAAIDAVRVALELTDVSVVGHSYGGMLAVALGAGGGYQAAVNVDGIGFRVPGSPMEDLAQDYDSDDSGGSGGELPPQSGDADWMAAELAAEQAEAAGMGLQLAPDAELFRRGFQLRPDGTWHRSPALDRFGELYRAVGMRELLPTYAATRCRTVTVLADRRDGPSPERVAASERHAELVREALTRLPPTSPARHLATVATGHYPQFEAPTELATVLTTALPA